MDRSDARHGRHAFALFVYVVTTIDTRIIYANDAACALLQSPKNALAGNPLVYYVPLEERGAFRAALLRSIESQGVTTWPAALLPSGARVKVDCRVRVLRASMAGSRIPRALYWNIMEESDEDCF